MRKINILYAAWAAALLLGDWFIMELAEAFTPFLMFLPLGIALVWTIAFAVWALVLLLRGAGTSRRRTAVPVLIMACAILLIGAVDFAPPKAALEHRFLRGAREEIVREIGDGELAPDAFGSVSLPEGNRRLSSDGTAMVIRARDGRDAVGFWTNRGLMLSDVSWITVYVPDGEPPAADAFGAQAVAVRQRLDEDWYDLRIEW